VGDCSREKRWKLPKDIRKVKGGSGEGRAVLIWSVEIVEDFNKKDHYGEKKDHKYHRKEQGEGKETLGEVRGKREMEKNSGGSPEVSKVVAREKVTWPA